MRKIIISFCILLAALSLKAQPVSGIRIDGGDTPILVYFGGRQMCYPTTTCFVANLKPGNIPLKCTLPARLARENVYGKENGCIMTAFTLTETK